MGITLKPSTLTKRVVRGFEHQRKQNHKLITTRMFSHTVNMARRKLLLLLKPLDVYPTHPSLGIPYPKIVSHFEDRIQVHKDAIKLCQDVLQKKMVDCETMFHSDLSRPIQDVDLVITVGVDGTLLKASHFMDDRIPVLGVNSDPTQMEEVEQFKDEFDASRSTGYLCAATVKNFEQVLDDILDERAAVSELSRISIHVNSQLLCTHPLNDLLIAHPCPASLSRFSFRLRNDSQSASSLVNCRSSGLRVSTAAGSTAAMLSGGGHAMPILSRELQYMVREPILSAAANPSVMHGLVKSDQTMEIAWSTKEGDIYVNGCHVVHPIKHGDIITLSTKAPVLKIFLKPELANGHAKL